MRTLTITVLLIAVAAGAIAAEYVVSIPDEHAVRVENAFAIKYPIPSQLSDPGDSLSALVPKFTKKQWVEMYMRQFASEVVDSVNAVETARAKAEAQAAQEAAQAAAEAREAEEAAAIAADAADTETSSDTGTE